MDWTRTPAGTASDPLPLVAAGASKTLIRPPTLSAQLPAAIVCLHKRAKDGLATKYFGTNVRIVEFLITEHDRTRWPVLAGAIRVQLVYGLKAGRTQSWAGRTQP